MAIRVIAIEGDAVDGSEQGIIPAEATADATDLSLDFTVETPAVFFSEPVLARLVVVEAQTESQTVTVVVIHDNTETTLSTTISTSGGVKSRVEIPIALIGNIFSVRLTATGLTSRIEISAIELDFDSDGQGEASCQRAA
jgi:hypothetical protein